MNSRKFLLKTMVKLLLFVCAFPAIIFAQEWPKEITASNFIITMYQPQLESFNEIKLEARAAVSIKPNDSRELIFGAVWISSLVSTDRDTRTVDLIDVKITAAKFPDKDDKEVDKLKEILEEEIPNWDIYLSLDDLIASLEFAEKEKAVSENFATNPPKIIFVTSPAVLVLIDGDPILKEIKDANIKYVVNTPFFIVQDMKSNSFYLKGGVNWYISESALGPWYSTMDVPKSILELAEKSVEKPEETGEEKAEKIDSEKKEVIPSIIISTVPAELIETDGEPEFSPIDGTNLLYMSNTESDVLMDINSQQYFVLISGRWYTSKSMTGDWTYVPPDDLGEDFEKIPPESARSNVRVSVAGTNEAKEAMLDTQIPQTATVDRKETKVEVKYDGEPKFEKVEDTKLLYAVNTDKAVVQFDERYYCCDNAVWFVSNSASGPWIVCDSIPAEIYKIPPSCPIYNVKYVYVYQSTPEVVYVGYYPGYTGYYVYGPTIIYGTGYYYRPWYGHYYYPRPVTWGFGVHYNPYYGWSFSFGVRFGGPHGWFSVGFGRPAYRGWWGPAGYRSGYRHGYYHGRRAGYAAGYRAGYRRSQTNNIYKNRKTGVRATGNNVKNLNNRKTVSSNKQARSRGTTGKKNKDKSSLNRQAKNKSKDIKKNDRKNIDSQKAKPALKKKNNVYADKDGNVHRKSGNTWEKRKGNEWSAENKKNKSNTSKRNNDLNKQSKARNRGSARHKSYNKSQNSSRSKAAGKRSGGGRRR